MRTGFAMRSPSPRTRPDPPGGALGPGTGVPETVTSVVGGAGSDVAGAGSWASRVAASRGRRRGWRCHGRRGGGVAGGAGGGVPGGGVMGGAGGGVAGGGVRAGVRGGVRVGVRVGVRR